MPPGKSSVAQSSDMDFCGIGRSVRAARQRRRRKQPWVIRKIWILVTFGIIGYTGYVYIARLCLPMIKRKMWAPASQTTGILLLIFFDILFSWMIWAYFTVILTSPGYARDNTPQTARPPLTNFSAALNHSHSHQDRDSPSSEMEMSDTIDEQNVPNRLETPPQDGNLASGPSYNHMQRSDPMPSHQIQVSQPPLSADQAHISTTTQNLQIPAAQSRSDAKRLAKAAARKRRLDELNIFRKPSSTPILQPVFRYCEKDEIIRPYRAHHCSSCGTCVLKYDHHCPWIGQCVGAQNYKLFLNFCFATSVSTAYIFASVLFFLIRSTRILEGDPQIIVLLILAALFFLFTTTLCISHVRLITRGQTTVESMYIKSMREREDYTLAREFAWWECGAKRQMRKVFDEEWGSMNTEGNIWWRGSVYDEWVDVMGTHWIGWIFPTGRGLSDGLSYPINPRFDSDGRLRKRSEWPENLR